MAVAEIGAVGPAAIRRAHCVESVVDASATTGGLDKHANHGNIDVAAWTSTWTKGPIAP